MSIDDSLIELPTTGYCPNELQPGAGIWDEGGQSGIANLAAAGLGATILHSIQQKNQDNWILEAKSIPWPTWKKIKDVRKEVVESAT